MPRFEVEIQGGGLEWALATLNGAGIPTLGPAFSGWGNDPEEWTVGHEMWAVFDARSAEAAEARVKGNLPPDGDYTVSPAKPLKRDD
jgi:hypothetical protein